MSSFEYVRRWYKVPAKRGLRVTVDGQKGRITRGKGSHIMVRFDGVKFSVPCHPTWRVTYHTPDGDRPFGHDTLHGEQVSDKPGSGEQLSG